MRDNYRSFRGGNKIFEIYLGKNEDSLLSFEYWGINEELVNNLTSKKIKERMIIDGSKPFSLHLLKGKKNDNHMIGQIYVKQKDKGKENIQYIFNKLTAFKKKEKNDDIILKEENQTIINEKEEAFKKLIMSHINYYFFEPIDKELFDSFTTTYATTEYEFTVTVYAYEKQEKPTQSIEDAKNVYQKKIEQFQNLRIQNLLKQNCTDPLLCVPKLEDNYLVLGDSCCLKYIFWNISHRCFILSGDIEPIKKMRQYIETYIKKYGKKNTNVTIKLQKDNQHKILIHRGIFWWNFVQEDEIYDIVNYICGYERMISF